MRISAPPDRDVLGPGPSIGERLKLGLSFIAAWAYLALIFYGWLGLLRG